MTLLQLKGNFLVNECFPKNKIVTNNPQGCGAIQGGYYD